jgi:uncharacterized protein YpuA (DUF1002 family)
LQLTHHELSEIFEIFSEELVDNEKRQALVQKLKKQFLSKYKDRDQEIKRLQGEIVRLFQEGGED